jgi:hypothetical protein
LACRTTVSVRGIFVHLPSRRYLRKEMYVSQAGRNHEKTVPRQTPIQMY